MWAVNQFGFDGFIVALKVEYRAAGPAPHIADRALPGGRTPGQHCLLHQCGRLQRMKQEHFDGRTGWLFELQPRGYDSCVVHDQKAINAQKISYLREFPVLDVTIFIDQQLRLIALLQWMQRNSPGRQIVDVFVNVDHEAKLSATFGA